MIDYSRRFEGSISYKKNDCGEKYLGINTDFRTFLDDFSKGKFKGFEKILNESESNNDVSSKNFFSLYDVFTNFLNKYL